MHRLLAFCLSYFSLGLINCLAGNFLIVPFHNVSGEPSLDWIGESIAETIRETIVSHGLPAIDREAREIAAHELSILPSTLPTKGTIVRLGRHMDASHVVFGEFTVTSASDSSSLPNGRLEIRAQCINLASGTRGPEWSGNGDLAELSRLQALLSRRVVQYADANKAPGESEFLETYPPVRIDAMESYIRGLLASELGQKHRFFAQAVNLEPEFSQPCFQLGRLQWEETSYRAAAQWLQKVKPRDAHYLEANFLLGLCRYYTGDYSGAVAAFQLIAASVELAEVFNNLAISQYRHGSDDAADNLRKALDAAPEDQDYQFNAGYMLWRQGDLDGAQGYFSRALELEPNDADARQMLERCRNQNPPRRGDLSSEGLERLKEEYEVLRVRIRGRRERAEDP